MCMKSLSYYFADCYINKSERCGSRCKMSSYHASIKDIYIRSEEGMQEDDTNDRYTAIQGVVGFIQFHSRRNKDNKQVTALEGFLE